MKRLGAFVLCLLVGISVTVNFQWIWFLIHPSDANMISHFERNRESFEHLAERFRHDRELNTVSIGREVRGERKETRTELPQNPQSLQAMNTLKIGTVRKDLNERSQGVYFIFSMSDPSRPSGELLTTKGYVYSEVPLYPMVDSTDSIDREAEREVRVYKQIAPNWYIFLDVTEIKCRS